MINNIPMRWALVLLLLLTSPIRDIAQNEAFCGIPNRSFQAGEKLTYEVFYNLGHFYIGAGQAVFSVALEDLGGHEVYHLTGTGTTFHSYDWFYKVRDRYESFVDTSDLLPRKFIRNVYEGGYKIYNNVTFLQDQGTAVSTHGVISIPHCIQDVLSSIYYARNIDYDTCRVGEKIPFSLFIDDKVYNIYIRYMGRKRVRTRFGTFNSIIIRPLLIQGTLFKGGEGMTVWVSDDPNHIPLRINSPISVGSIKVDMVGYEHIRFPLSSLVNRDTD